MNAVGLQGPGVEAWRTEGLPRLESRGATVVASIWGRTTDEFAAAAEALHGAEGGGRRGERELPQPARRLGDVRALALGDGGRGRRGDAQRPAVLGEAEPDHRPARRRRARGRRRGGGGARAREHAARARRRRRPSTSALGAGPGGLSGPPLHPVAAYWVAACHAALPTTPIIGVGGVRSAREVVAFVLAGADAVEVGTASLADPRAPWKVQRATRRWCARHGVARLSDLKGQLDG